MSHGFMGLKPMGYLYLGASTAFLYYLSRSFTGPTAPKYEVDPAIALMAKEYQPAIVPEYYFRKERNTE